MGTFITIYVAIGLVYLMFGLIYSEIHTITSKEVGLSKGWIERIHLGWAWYLPWICRAMIIVFGWSYIFVSVIYYCIKDALAE